MGAFEYVSILVSIIIGLGITQILSSFSDLLFNFKKVKFYWPHILWVMFTWFLLIVDWFITYQLREREAWRYPELMFVLGYAVTIFIAIKMIMPSSESEHKFDIKKFYQAKFPVIFFIIGIVVLGTMFFNVFMLGQVVYKQWHLLFTSIVLIFLAVKKIEEELIHKIFAISITIAWVSSVFLNRDVWVIK